MTSEHLRYRSDILNTQVITRNTGKRLGIVRELLVDIDRREVVALGLRDNMLSFTGLPRFMFLDRIRQIGDVILVDDDSVIEDVDVDAYSSLVNHEVITEAGQPLGKVRGFKFDMEDGKVLSLIISAIGYPQIPEQLVSTYELPVDEIISSGPNRLIVFEGAEERVNQLTVGVLERIGIGVPPWERDEEEEYLMPTTRPENQLGTGVRIPTSQPVRASAPAIQETWDEDDWGGSEPAPLRRRQAEPAYYYEDEEEDNWSDASNNRQQAAYAEPAPYDEPRYADEYDDYEEDAWADSSPSPEPYQAPAVNIPEKAKMPEYEEEAGY